MPQCNSKMPQERQLFDYISVSFGWVPGRHIAS